MANSITRVTAGVAVVFAFTAAGGLGAAISSADPGSSKSPPSHSRDGGHSRGDGNGPRSQLGSRDGGNRQPSNGDGSPTRDTAGRDTSTVAAPDSTAASRGVVVESTAPTVVAQTPTAAAPTPAAAESAGSGLAPDVGAPAVAPWVRVGSGRTPGALSERSGESSAQVSDELDVVQPPPVVSVPPPARPWLVAPPLPAVASSPWPLVETPLVSLWGDVRPGWPMGALFGIAGLLLAPIAGVWVGHRQARASKSASELVGH